MECFQQGRGHPTPLLKILHNDRPKITSSAILGGRVLGPGKMDIITEIDSAHLLGCRPATLPEEGMEGRGGLTTRPQL